MNTIAQHMIFLHGPSGAGKGEMQRKLEERLRKDGYEVMVVSSGDLFRMAAQDPEIAEKNEGRYLH